MKTKISFRVSRLIVIMLLAAFCGGLIGCAKNNPTANTNTMQNSAPSNTKAQQSPASSVSLPDEAVTKSINVMQSYVDKDGKFKNSTAELKNRDREIESLYKKLTDKSGGFEIWELAILDYFLYKDSNTTAEERKKTLNDLSPFIGIKNNAGQNPQSSEGEIQKLDEKISKVSKEIYEIRGDGNLTLANLSSPPEGSLSWYWKNTPLVFSSFTAFVLLILLILKYFNIPFSNTDPLEKAGEHTKPQRFQRGIKRTAVAAGHDTSSKIDLPEAPNSGNDMESFLNSFKTDLADEIITKLKPEINKINERRSADRNVQADSLGTSEINAESDGRVNKSFYDQPLGTGEQITVQKFTPQSNNISFPSFVEEIERLNAPRLNYERIADSFVEADNGNFYLINDNKGRNCIVPAVKYFMKKTDYIPFLNFYYQSGDSEEDGKVRIDMPAIVQKENGSWRFTGEKGSLSVIA